MAGGELLYMERTYEAPVAAVFDAWTSEEVLRRWFHAGSDWTTSEASVDLRVGGALRVVMREPGGEPHGGGGVYTEVDPPSRLAFTWVWDNDDEARESLVEIDFEADGGLTTVRFNHSGLRDLAQAKDHEGGWTRCFDNLDRALAGASAR
jgi:uncharacterized protein YndB with AHSA1/START domain